MPHLMPSNSTSSFAASKIYRQFCAGQSGSDKHVVSNVQGFNASVEARTGELGIPKVCEGEVAAPFHESKSNRVHVVLPSRQVLGAEDREVGFVENAAFIFGPVDGFADPLNLSAEAGRC